MSKESFRSEFASIVYFKGLIKSHLSHIKSLHNWDKNGSHNEAILRALAKRDELKKDFEIKLKGKTYEEWLAISRKLTVLTQKLKRKTADKNKIESQIMELTNQRTRQEKV